MSYSPLGVSVIDIDRAKVLPVPGATFPAIDERHALWGVEDVLYEHPAVREAAVVGIPDEYRGETVKAFVSLRPGAEATEAELIEFCKERMAAYKYPRQVAFVDELPKTGSGKVLKRELRAPYWAGHGTNV